VDKCQTCYDVGGLVYSSTSSGCYCPSSSSFLNLNDPNISCEDPLPTCSSCYTCHSTCLTCFGPNDNQCLSCTDDLEFFSILDPINGLLYFFVLFNFFFFTYLIFFSIN